MFLSMRPLALLPMLLLTVFGPVATHAEDAPPSDLVLIVDASGSMWGQIDGENKIVIARRALGTLVDGLDENTTVGLVAYGHRREGDCADIETVMPLGPLDKEALKAMVDGLNPKGKTPITASVEQAFALLEGREHATSVILVSDGLETCGGDPCAAVRTAREAGARFVMHVVGFDVGGEDVSQLECMSQAGDGRFLTAEDAASLSEALDTVAAMPAEVPDGRLVVHAEADGELQDVAIYVSDAETGEVLVGGRTYSTAATNPHSTPLADGRYDVRVQAVGIKGDIERRFENVEIVDGGTVEKRVDFSTGEVAFGVTRNGALSDATVNIYVAGTNERVGGGRTYTSESNNPMVVRLTSGRYDAVIGSVEIAGAPDHRFENFEIPPRGRIDLAHAYESGDLSIGVRRGDTLIDAVVRVYDATTDKEVDGSRSYTTERTNPSRFVVPPGDYRVRIAEIRGEERSLEVSVDAGGEVEHIVDLDAPE